jgi:hypothetical protein
MSATPKNGRVRLIPLLAAGVDEACADGGVSASAMTLFQRQPRTKAVWDSLKFWFVFPSMVVRSRETGFQKLDGSNVPKIEKSSVFRSICRSQITHVASRSASSIALEAA